MRFYEIDAQIEAALAELVDEDGVINEDAESVLAALEAEAEAKTEGILLAIKGMAAEAEAIRGEEKNLAERRHSLEKKAEALKGFIQTRLAGQKFKTPRVAVSYRKTTAVEVDEGSWLFWPEELQDAAVSYTAKVDKNEIKKRLKDGEAISGARLIDGQSMSIK